MRKIKRNKNKNQALRSKEKAKVRTQSSSPTQAKRRVKMKPKSSSPTRTKRSKKSQRASLFSTHRLPNFREAKMKVKMRTQVSSLRLGRVKMRAQSSSPKISLDEKIDIEQEGTKRTKIRVIGIGGGGGSIISEIAPKMPKASFVAANTDLQALKSLGKKVLRVQFGDNLTHGLGTGMNTDFGRDAALEAKEKITKLLEGQDLCILVASLGGGAGSGAAPIFAKISKSLGNLTYGIFTLPFKFEGEKKMEIAKDALQKIKSSLNAITIIPNERAFQIIDKNTPLKQALSVINKNLSDSLGGLIETIYEPGLINIDFADFKTIMEGGGKLAYLNTVEAQRKNSSIKEMIEKVLSSPLYPYNVKGAKAILFNIAGEKNLSLSEVSQISKTISELANPEAKIIFGISQSQKYSDIIKITLLANGCGMKSSPREDKEGIIKKKRSIKKRILAAVSVSSKAENIKRSSLQSLAVSEPPAQEKEKRKFFSLPNAIKGKNSKTEKNPKNHPDTRAAVKSGGERMKQRKLKIKFIKKEAGPVSPVEESPSQLQQYLIEERAKRSSTSSSPLLTRAAAKSGEERMFSDSLRESSVGEEKIRKNALQIKKEMEEIEQEIAEKEKFWETPAFLRRKPGKTS